MMIKKISKKLWSACFLFVVVGLVVVALTLISRILEANTESEKVLSSYIGGNTDVVILKRDISQAEKTIEILEEKLLAPRDTVNLVTYVESISARVGLNPVIENLNAQKMVMVEDRETDALELIVEMKGSFEETQKFLTLMENLPYQSKIGDVRLRKIGDRLDSDEWQILIQVIVFILPQA